MTNFPVFGSMDGARSFVIALAFGMTILATSLALMTGEERKLRTRAGKPRENDIVKDSMEAAWSLESVYETYEEPEEFPSYLNAFAAITSAYWEQQDERQTSSPPHIVLEV
jgi:hypothetical protein